MSKLSVMHVNKLVFIGFILFGGISFSEEKEVCDIIHAHIKFNRLLNKKQVNKCVTLTKSSVLGDDLLDVSKLFAKDGISVDESSAIIYGPNTNLLFVKCSPEALSEIKNAYSISLKDRDVYKLKIDLVDNIKSPDSTALAHVETLVVSGEIQSLKLENDKILELMFTKGPSADGAPLYRVRVSGLRSIGIEDDIAVSSNVLLGEKKVILNTSHKKGAKKVLRLELQKFLINEQIPYLLGDSDYKKNEIETIKREIQEQ